MAIVLSRDGTVVFPWATVGEAFDVDAGAYWPWTLAAMSILRDCFLRASIAVPACRLYGRKARIQHPAYHTVCVSDASDPALHAQGGAWSVYYEQTLKHIPS